MTPNDKWRANNHEKAMAHWKIEQLVRTGKLKKQPCEICGATERIHAHHDDYSKPYEIRWLCTVCHRKLHAKLQGQQLREPKEKKTPRKESHSHWQPSPKRDALLAKAQRLKSQGSSYRQIAKELSVSTGTVYKWLNNTEYS